MEALCMMLRRLAYPNRLCELEVEFGRHGTVICSVANKVLSHIENYIAHLLSDMNNHDWMTPSRMREFAEAVHTRGAQLRSCWGFIDGTACQISGLTMEQQEFSSGNKRFRGVKYQAVMCANGIICELDGPYKGRRHDACMLFDSIDFLVLPIKVQKVLMEGLLPFRGGRNFQHIVFHCGVLSCSTQRI
ncbi:hypothetical protein HPB48_003031 [Haemaphysalis longicornis]|uniref:DDE Tnp4 domain-containing protein n=1 Tax=Haemaphysalis longicornis TaxID=44386 RepID=A0A9J6FQK5_HAELO|nr:hypothetical protein HPB48_003031 [Haemaphysalis longicornis]